MGNTHARAVAIRKKRLGRQRRLSEPESDYNDNQLRPGGMKMSRSGATTPTSVTPPRIQINGMEDAEEIEDKEVERKKSHSIVSLGLLAPVPHRCSKDTTENSSKLMLVLLTEPLAVHNTMQKSVHYLNTIQEDIPSTTVSSALHSASLRRMQFLSSSSSTNISARRRSINSSGIESTLASSSPQMNPINIKSLDDPRSVGDLQMKPLSRAKSHSPLKQMRTYSYRSLSSEENALDKAACDLIKSSWHEATISANATGRHFGYFVFQRVFQKDPTLKDVFGLQPDQEISDIADDHECIRHTKIFTNIIHLAAKNVDELEAQVAPAIFKYGERHYSTKASDRMCEENVRLVCAQVVCTVCDLLGDAAQPQTVEAWIEMMRYLGRKLLEGFEYAKLTAKHRISINRNDHHLFLML